jgi:hypothetical protein
MGVTSNAFSFSTALLVAFAAFVIYTRYRNWLDSNVPLIFYVIMLVYTNSLDGGLNPMIVYIALGLGLILRFEFMNSGFAKVVKSAEIVMLCVIIFNLVKIIID